MRILHAAVWVSALLVISFPLGLDSCVILARLPVFSTSQRPGDEGQFFRGKLGVLRQSYRGKYLIAAFRILSGVPLAASEIKSLSEDPYENGYRTFTPAQDRWFENRSRLDDLFQRGTTYMGTSWGKRESLEWVENCHDDAFLHATRTLEQLKKKWGHKDPRTFDWVAAQDRVFSLCSGSGYMVDGTIGFPDPPNAKMDPLLASHRRYQIAASYFYSGQYRNASAAFEQIAKEPGSPWREMAPYLVARSLLRAMTFQTDPSARGESKEKLLAILKDPKQQRWHKASSRLLHFWQLQVEPEARFAELGKELVRSYGDDIGQGATDFAYLLNKQESYGPLTEALKDNDLAAWMFCMYGRTNETAEHATLRWKKTQHPAWLIAALMNAEDLDLPALLADAKKVSPSSPAYESVAYYATLREVGRGNKEQARQWADGALRQNLQRSTRNLILGLRTQVARNWNDFLVHSLRRPEAKILVGERGESPANGIGLATGDAPVFDEDVIDAFNKTVPFSLWIDAVSNPIVPPHIQLRIAKAAWLRAILLNRMTDARNLMQRIIALEPQAAEVGQRFLDANNLEEARFAAVYLVMLDPQLVPAIPRFYEPTTALGKSRYFQTSVHLLGWMFSHPQDQPTILDLGFLSAKHRAEHAAEWKLLQASEKWEGTFLARTTLDWVGKHSNDPVVPEVLHRAVMATGFRSDGGQNGKYSEQAFNLLHRKYPKSPWTARTKYWYK